MSLGTDWLSFLTPSGTRTTALPADLCALILDTVQAPATFLLTNFLARALRQSPARHSTLVGLAHTLDHYEAILKKNVCPCGDRRRRLVGQDINNPEAAWSELTLVSLSSSGYSLDRRAQEGSL